jgi:hypothetical protein
MLHVGWLAAGYWATRRTWIARDDLFIVSAQKRIISDSGSALSDGGAKISPPAHSRAE